MSFPLTLASLPAQTEAAFNGPLPVQVLVATGVFVGLLMLFAVITIAYLRYAKIARKLLHDERIKAIEAGSPWNDPEIQSTQDRRSRRAANTAFWLVLFGCGVPFLAVAIVNNTSNELLVIIAPWICAAAASIAAAICSTILIANARD